MSFFDRFRTLVQSKQWIGSALWMAADHVIPAPIPAPAPFAPDATYLRMWLTAVHLDNSREWFTEWHPAVHSAISRDFGNASDQEVAVIGPASIPGFEGAARGGILQEKALTPLLPFPGGSVTINVGLVAVKGDNVLRTLIDTVSSFGSIIPAAPISTGVDIANKVVDAFEKLVGISRDVGALAFDGELALPGGGAPRDLTPGYLAVLDSTPNPDSIGVHNGQLMVWDGQAYTPPPGSHLLLRLESRTERDDWQYLTDINKALTGARSTESPDTRRAYYQQAIIAARTSPDLHEADRIKYAAKLKELRDLDEGYGARATPTPGDAAELAESITMSNDEALQRKPVLGDLLA